MEKYTDLIDNKDQFVSSVQDNIKTRVFNKLQELKKNIAKDFLKSDEDESN